MASMSDATDTTESLRREISRLGFGAMSLNGVIGAGIFALPAFDGLGETILVLLYAFVGFEGAVVPAG